MWMQTQKDFNQTTYEAIIIFPHESKGVICHYVMGLKK